MVANLFRVVSTVTDHYPARCGYGRLVKTGPEGGQFYPSRNVAFTEGLVQKRAIVAVRDSNITGHAQQLKKQPLLMKDFHHCTALPTF